MALADAMVEAFQVNSFLQQSTASLDVSHIEAIKPFEKCLHVSILFNQEQKKYLKSNL